MHFKESFGKMHNMYNFLQLKMYNRMNICIQLLCTSSATLSRPRYLKVYVSLSLKEIQDHSWLMIQTDIFSYSRRGLTSATFLSLHIIKLYHGP